MTGYLTKQQRVRIAGVDDLVIRSLLDRQQFDDPHGEAQRLGISSAEWPLFGLLWPSGAQLAARLGARPVRASERILEVGCGLALASLVGHRRGADVTASDCHPLAESFLRENLRLNGLAPLPYCQGHWARPEVPPGQEDAAGPPLVRGRFDLIIGGDLLYERDPDAFLAGFIARHCSHAGEVWIIDPDRGNRAAFSRQMAAHGFLAHAERVTAPGMSTALGDAGAQGDAGAPGSTGAPGDAGAPGSTGAAGYRGHLLTFRRALRA